MSFASSSPRLAGCGRTDAAARMRVGAAAAAAAAAPPRTAATAASAAASVFRSPSSMGTCRLIASAAASDVGSTEPPPSLEAVLQAELEYEKDDFQVDEEMEKGPEGWTMQMEENNTTVLLSKTFGTEKVVIEMYAEDDDEDDDDDFDFDEFDGEEEGTESEASSADGVAKDGDDLDDELFDDDDIDKMEFFVTVSKTTEADDDESKRLLQFTCIAESGGYFIKKVRPHYQFPGGARARARSVARL